ncbi:hypothetical protein [Xanthomonas sp. LMG 12460]|uniref:hypothetical protein n=1 Tax=Xanthomonas sp. LMG 12460 TaxID=1591132 RepID=UPI001264A7F2|nr:hypothetical protein [Xanthomonas sp. LMG 12460]KAB7775654.1 hypothetical protein CEK66_16650 [Xanthomonas sp. LMG 12460]
MEMANIDWLATAQLVAVIGLSFAGLASGIRASLRLRRLERARRVRYSEAYMHRVYQREREQFYDPFD